jgi:hypothetical protein
MSTKQQPDVRVENHGTLFVFQPLTDAGRTWIDEHVESESWQWIGGGLSVEHRYAEHLATGMQADGLTVVGGA